MTANPNTIIDAGGAIVGRQCPTCAGGNCLRIVESIPDPDEAENDIKKYFRYV